MIDDGRTVYGSVARACAMLAGVEDWYRVDAWDTETKTFTYREP